MSEFVCVCVDVSELGLVWERGRGERESVC